MNEGLHGEPADFAVGSVVAGYRLEEQIGLGGMAVVFRAYDPRLDRHVALKILAPRLAADESFRRRFIRESRAAAAVDDPHIIPIFEAGEASGVLFIAMRFVRGGDVKLLLDREGPLTPARVIEIIAQVASALDSAHVRGLVHRDVKPANMLLDSSAGRVRPDHVYLSDFGLTKVSRTTDLTSTGQFLGTLDYVAPEQVQGGLVDGRTDQYSLACATFELLTGAPPFHREHDMAVMYAQVSESPPPLSSRRPGTPAAADAVMNKALAKLQVGRYDSCGEFVEALRRAFGLGADDPEARTDPVRMPTQIAAPIQRPLAQAASHPTGPAITAGAGLPGGHGREGGPGGYPTVARSERPPADKTGGSGHGPWPWWRPPILAAVACVVIVAAIGGYFLFSHGSASRPLGYDRDIRPVGQTVRCTTFTPALHTFRSVPSQNVSVGGAPVAAAQSSDGRYTFVTVGKGIAVLSNSGGRPQTLVRTVPVPGAANGLALTSDGRYLIAASGRGAVVVSVPAAEHGTGHPVVGTLTGPHGSGAVGVMLSPDGKFLFVTLQNSTTIAVFHFAEASHRGFSTSGFSGFIPLGDQPFAMRTSLDGKWLYATSFGRTRGGSPGEGTLSVINLATAEMTPARSVRTIVNAGCGPVRIQTQKSTNTVWVTARDSNALLAFSASRLLADPGRALLAIVQVGHDPIGLTPLGTDTFVIADSNYASPSHAAGNLAVVRTDRALAHKPALLGVIPAAGQPYQLTQTKHNTILLVTNQSPGNIQIISLANLP